MENNVYYGAAITLMGYIFLIVSIYLAIFALLPFIVGNVISAYGLSKKKSQKALGVYLAFTIVTFILLFFLGSPFGLSTQLAYIYALPAMDVTAALILGLGVKSAVSN